MTDSTKTLLGYLLIGGILLAYLFAWNSTHSNCESKGGQLARGTFWFVCVNEDNP